MHQRLCHGVRCTGLWIFILPVDPVNIFGAIMKTVVAQFRLQILKYEKNAGQAEGKTKNIDERINLVLDEVSQRNLEVVGQHRLWVVIVLSNRYTNLICRFLFEKIDF